MLGYTVLFQSAPVVQIPNTYKAQSFALPTLMVSNVGLVPTPEAGDTQFRITPLGDFRTTPESDSRIIP